MSSGATHRCRTSGWRLRRVKCPPSVATLWNSLQGRHATPATYTESDRRVRAANGKACAARHDPLQLSAMPEYHAMGRAAPDLPVRAADVHARVAEGEARAVRRDSMEQSAMPGLCQWACSGGACSDGAYAGDVAIPWRARLAGAVGSDDANARPRACAATRDEPRRREGWAAHFRRLLTKRQASQRISGRRRFGDST